MKGAWLPSSSILFFGCMIFITQVGHCYGQLKEGFYQGKCGPNDIEKLIFNVVQQKFALEPDTVSDLVRLSFHDCFVRGCDASIFLDGPKTEQKAPANEGIGGLDIVNDIKDAVEKVCPGVVSCADVLIIGARDSIFLAGGKWYDVETGRRDGRVSIDTEAMANLPPPNISIPASIFLFAQKGLTISDMVVLLGGHTVGTAHCRSFKDRLYNFQNTQQPDPSISASLLELLRKTCPLNDQTDKEVFLDQTPNSQFKIDNAYYKQILANNGTLKIDQNLASSPLTKLLVNGLARFPIFETQFGKAMVKMSRIGVLTGNQGEIRKSCNSVN
ncbi:unnamed protein product [Amaranthus hypochondriacus]